MTKQLSALENQLLILLNQKEELLSRLSCEQNFYLYFDLSQKLNDINDKINHINMLMRESAGEPQV